MSHRRLPSTAAAALSALVVLLGLAAPAVGLGAQDVDLSPLVPRHGGLLTHAVGERSDLDLQRTNSAADARTVSVFATAATRDDDSGWTLGTTLDWITVDGGTDLHLAPTGEVVLPARIDLTGYHTTRPTHIAIILQVGTSSTLTTRAATIVALTDAGATLPVPTALLILATALLAVVAAARIRTARHHGLTPATTR